MKEVTTGSVHGRFQPLHNGHMEYILAAQERCQFLYVGLTQPDIRALRSTVHGSHRALKYSNPLSYFERQELVTQSLEDSGVERSLFSVIPFPIETADRLTDFLPLNVTCFTTIYEDWNVQKVRLLEAVGYRVEVLWRRAHKAVQGSEIRDSIRVGKEDWKRDVPQATIDLVARLDLRSRLESLSAADI